MHSDLHDLALWDQNFYTGKVGGRELIARMHEVGLLNSGKSTGYAAGLNVFESRGFTWVTHGGSWVGYRSSIMRVPSERLSAIVLCNRAEADAGAYAREIMEHFLGDRLGPRRARGGGGAVRAGRRAVGSRRPVALRRRVLQQ